MSADPRVALHDEDESSDAAEVPGLDLTPRDRGTRSRSTRTRAVVWGGVLVVIAAAGFVAIRNLAGATVFYYEVDEAQAERANLGADTFRMLGTVACGSVTKADDGVDFRVTSGGATTAVHSVGAPPQLFQEGIPVLLEGSWSADGSRFDSSAPIVAHTEQYIEKNNDRLTEAGNPDDVKLTEGGMESANLCGDAGPTR